MTVGFVMFGEKQLAEYAQLRHDLISMDLVHSHPTTAQFLQVERRIKQSLSPSIWHDFALTQQISEERAIIMNNPSTDRLMILLILWPGQIQGNIHNHNTWAAIGVVRGLEENVVWNLTASTDDKGFGLDLAYRQQLSEGDVCIIPDKNIIHSVNNLSPKDQVSISIHVYGEDLRETDRHTFDLSKNVILNNTNEEFITLDDYMSIQ
jgi:predicted metal-dependent enzyme (double-stranded beta helix superfamily)